jgi:serine/threonine protein kinase
MDSLVAGKYRILEEIGQGGMGIVYKAEDLKLKRFVALKFLPPHLMNSPELKERFLVEAQAAAALSHPNICVIHEVGESVEYPYIAMEYVEGETLRDRIRKGPLKSEEALAIVGQVASGLAEAHQKGIIHRDIKSANIMVTDKGQAKVMDFGLAKFSGGSSLTKSQTTLGTVAYMSPEQARGGKMDRRTDIWSLGVVFYEMLTAKLPFRGDHDQAVIYSILHDEPESLKKTRPDTTPGLDEIVGQALAKKPADRYKTMEEFREDLEAVAEGLKPLRAKRRPVRRILGIRTDYVYSALVILLALILGLNVGGLRNRLLGRVAPAPAIRLAVLPFENLSGDPQQEYFSDGMTQEMIAQLGRLHPESLSVIARSSVLRYKKTNTPIDQVGRELNVGYVLEGSVQREGTRVRITAELIKVRDQSQLWSDSIEREMSGILA